MSKECSFDIVSNIDLQEVDNAVHQALKEIQTRYDFKGGKSTIEFKRDEKKLKVLADDDMKLRAMKEILGMKFAKRGISSKALKYGKEEKALGDAIRVEVELIQGIPQEKAKDIVRIIKDSKLKVQPRIQGDEIRVSGKQIDDLQQIMHLLKEGTLDIPLQFVNYR